ncbi:hypothetical protein CCMSSC00406_0009449 [Pleurotus cornucopiae]|uniref:Uncharacterized protein n=1 Tax=Pleurotus cornucopiae TaxID=5321 RepID=A0ACB7J1H6_PLECO|nr:hypothetical protein CCMSSC00406_0009449 [Pleurotus cornucopiae]
MAGFAIPRLVIFGLVTIFAFAVLGVDAHITSILAKSGTTTPIEGMGLATALFTILSIPAIVFSPKGSFPTTVLFETIWLSILWVFWLTTAALASDLRIKAMKELGPKGCAKLRDDAMALCMELPGIEGLSYVNWLLLMFYTVALCVFLYMARNGGHPNVWSASAREFPYSTRSNVDSPSNGTAYKHELPSSASV